MLATPPLVKKDALSVCAGACVIPIASGPRPPLLDVAATAL